MSVRVTISISGPLVTRERTIPYLLPQLHQLLLGGLDLQSQLLRLTVNAVADLLDQRAAQLEHKARQGVTKRQHVGTVMLMSRVEWAAQN